MTAFQLEVITPERTVYEGRVTSLVVQAEDGSLGVLGNHAPLLTCLDIGVATLREEAGGELQMMLGGGFLEVARNQARVLAEVGERADEIDEERARRAEERARARLKEHGDDDFDLARAEASLRRATTRMKLKRGLSSTGS